MPLVSDRQREEAHGAADPVMSPLTIEVEMDSSPPHEEEELSCNIPERAVDDELICPRGLGLMSRRSQRKQLRRHQSLSTLRLGEDLPPRPLTSVWDRHLKPVRRCSFRRRARSVDVPRGAAPSAPPLVYYSRSLSGLGNQGLRPGRFLPRALTLQCERIRELDNWAREWNTAVASCITTKSSEYEAQQDAAASAADFVSKLSLGESVKPPLLTINEAGTAGTEQSSRVRIVEFDQASEHPIPHSEGCV